MINISASDLLLIPELKGIPEVMLIHPSNDAKVLPYLWIMGLNYKRGYEVTCYRHRNLQQQDKVGFLYSGEIRTDDDFRHSAFCSSMDRVVMSAKQDFSLTQELSKMMGGGLHYGKFQDVEEDTDENEYLSVSLYEPDYEDTSRYITDLRNFVISVRGSAYNEYGSLKTHQEYLEAMA